MAYFTAVYFVDEKVDALCKVNSKYIPFVTYKGKRKVLYVVLNTSLYGTIQAAYSLVQIVFNKPAIIWIQVKSLKPFYS